MEQETVKNFIEGKWYLSTSLQSTALKYNGEDRCTGYWEKFDEYDKKAWGVNRWLWDTDEEWVEATKEDLYKLGNEWEEYWYEEVFDKGQPEIKPESLIGRKVKGFKFETRNGIEFTSLVEEHIGEVGYIINYFPSSNKYQVWFEDAILFYPAELVQKYLVEEVDTKEVEDKPKMREFSTGATRNLEDNKLDYEGFLSPLALEEFAKYMHKHRLQEDGKLRDSDNWQKGIPVDAYMKSMFRHFFDTWKNHRGLETPEDQITNLCAVIFNAQGMLHELLKSK
jgi:hypothetical protein